MVDGTRTLSLVRCIKPIAFIQIETVLFRNSWQLLRLKCSIRFALVNQCSFYASYDFDKIEEIFPFLKSNTFEHCFFLCKGAKEMRIL